MFVPTIAARQVRRNLGPFMISLEKSLPKERKRTVLRSLQRYGKPFQYDTDQPVHSRMTLSKILACRTGEYGSTAYSCDGCGESRTLYTQCNNRHCPGCGWLKRKAWLNTILSWNLPTTFCHAVFTTPHDFNELILANTLQMYRLFFRCAKDTLLKMCAKEFGCTPGVILTLHTWGQKMLTHVHIHAMMTAGGVSIPEKNKNEDSESEPGPEPVSTWIAIPADAPPMQNQSMADDFRDRFVRGVTSLYRRGKLVLPETMGIRSHNEKDAFQKWLAPIAKRSWIADAKITPDDCVKTMGCASYIGQYFCGTAIHDERMVSDDGTNVTISQWDYRTSRYVKESMPGAEFVGRFLLHIVPTGVPRTNYSGLFQPKGRKERLETVRHLLAKHNVANPSTRFYSQPNSSTSALDLEKTSNRPKCQNCGTKNMAFEMYRSPFETRGYITWLKRYIAYFAVIMTTLDSECQRVQRASSKLVKQQQRTFADWQWDERFEQVFSIGFVHSSVYEQANTISMFQSDATDLFTCFNPLPQP